MNKNWQIIFDEETVEYEVCYKVRIVYKNWSKKGCEQWIKRFSKVIEQAWSDKRNEH